MKTVIQLKYNEIIIENKNEFEIIEYCNNILAIYYDHNNKIQNYNITVDTLDIFLKNNPENILITSSDYIFENEYKFKKNFKNFNFKFNINNAKVIIDESNIYFGNNIKINKYFKNFIVNIKNHYIKLENRIINYNKKYKSILDKYKNLKIIEITNKAIFDLKNKNIFTELENNILHLQKEEKFEKNINIEKYIKYFIKKYKKSLLDFSIYFKYDNLIMNFFIYQDINYELENQSIFINNITNKINYSIDDNKLDKLKNEYDNIMNSMSQNNNKNYEYLFTYFEKKIKNNNEDKILNFQILIKNIEDLISIKQKFYEKKYKNMLNIYFKNKYNTYINLINNNFNVSLLNNKIKELYNNYRLIIDTFDYNNILILNEVKINIQNDNNYINKIINNYHKYINKYMIDINNIIIQEKLLKNKKNEILFSDVLDKIKIKESILIEINLKKKTMNISNYLEEFLENKKKERKDYLLEIENKEKKEKEISKNIIKNKEILNKKKKEYINYINYLNEMKKKNINNSTKIEIYKKNKKNIKKMKKMYSFRRNKTLTIW
jgi:hypothetical protein